MVVYKFTKENFRLYCDDGLIYLNNYNSRKVDSAGKKNQ